MPQAGRTRDLSVRTVEDSTCLRPHGHWDRLNLLDDTKKNREALLEDIRRLTQLNKVHVHVSRMKDNIII